MRVAKFWPAFIPLLLGVPLASADIAQAQEGAGHAFIISAAAGYGVEDCLGEGGDCGRVVADAWCEAHGHGAAISFGRAEDVTGSIIVAQAGAKAETPYVITCGE